MYVACTIKAHQGGQTSKIEGKLVLQAAQPAYADGWDQQPCLCLPSRWSASLSQPAIFNSAPPTVTLQRPAPSTGWLGTRHAPHCTQVWESLMSMRGLVLGYLAAAPWLPLCCGPPACQVGRSTGLCWAWPCMFSG